LTPHDRPEEEVCDLETIDSLRQEGAGLLRELIELFNRDVPKVLEELTQALSAGDCRTAERLAHTLRGTAGTFGANRMRELATAIELASHEGASEKAAATLGELRSECDRVRQALAAQVQA
jgi:two-component system, sensor histidine kinase and response regulator